VKKNYVEKRMLKMFLTEDEVLMGYRHWSISVRDL